MANKIASNPLPPALQRVASSFKIAGWVSFWAQIVLAVVSGAVLAFSGLNLGGTPQPGTSPNPGVGGGIFFAVCGLVALFIGAYFAFSYTRLARKLKTSAPQARPKPGDLVRVLRLGLLVNLSGTLLTLLGAQAIVGSLLVKSLSQAGSLFSGNLSKFVTPLDVFLVQANINTLMAHFVGVIATLWLIQVMNRKG
jgi:amino acid transporter